MALDQARRLVSQEDASMVRRPDIPRSTFLGSWSRKMTFDAGYLVPFLVDEVLPADHLKYNVTAFLRMSTALFPMMDSQRIDTHIFFVPLRILWANFVRMMGEQDNPTDSVAYTVPQLVSPAGGFPVHSLYDHLGLPTALDGAGTISVSALFARAYELIYHEWFRDQNIVNSQRPTTGDGPDLYTTYTLQRRAKSHDYFTSALPWPQKFTAPVVNLGGLAPVLGIAGVAAVNATAGNPAGTNYQTGGAVASGWLGHFGGDQTYIRAAGGGVAQTPQIFADLSAATGMSINVFREAFMYQAMFERDARGGTRYTEQVQNRFGVRPPDYRLQRPEYIGGGSTPLNITPIAQTAPGDGLSVGALGAAATAVGAHQASFASTEHGIVLGLISVKSELSYQQGVHRMFSRETRYDFYDPMLAGLGEQAILRKEIWAFGTTESDETVFGYQERWHEYRTRYSEVTGQFRSTTAGTLDGWHLGQRFNTAPVLNQAFIEDNPDMARVLAAGELAENQQYLADILIRREATRPIPMYGVPATLGRF